MFSRDKLILLLNEFNNVDSDIFNDFKEYILSIENEVNAFTDKEVWNKKNWIGFFKHLQNQLKQGDWEYVPNPNRGFMGFWWALQENEYCTQYLQLQGDQLVLKINSNKAENDKKFRNICYKYFSEKAKLDGLSFTKPARFGKGKTMTILCAEYIVKSPDTKLLDIEKTLKNINLYTKFIEKYALKNKEFFE